MTFDRFTGAEDQNRLAQARTFPPPMSAGGYCEILH